MPSVESNLRSGSNVLQVVAKTQPCPEYGLSLLHQDFFSQRCSFNAVIIFKAPFSASLCEHFAICHHSLSGAACPCFVYVVNVLSLQERFAVCAVFVMRL